MFTVNPQCIFVPLFLCPHECKICVCVSVCVCVCDCYRWPPSRWENAGSLLVCVHMYQTQHVFPLSEARYPVCVCVADHTGRLTSRNPCSKNRHCVFPALMHRYHRTHTHAHTWIITLFSFPLQVSSTPILLPPAIKMFRCDCHERTCSSGTNRRTQTGEE